VVKKMIKKNNKTIQREKESKVADITFGLKNKNKSKQVQSYVKSIQKNLGVMDDKSKELQYTLKNKELEKKKADLLLLQTLGVETGIKKKNNKEEDDEIVKNDKTDKIDIYKDTRGDEKEFKEENETNENWDQEMLEKVIKQKHGHRRAKTDKICRFFIDAIEKSKYGWFWKCVNGEDCI